MLQAGTGLKRQGFELGGMQPELLAPGPQVVRIERDAEQVSGNETELRGLHSDVTDNCAVGAGNNPALPQLPAHQDCRNDGQDTRNVIEPKHRNYCRLKSAPTRSWKHAGDQAGKVTMVRGQLV